MGIKQVKPYGAWESPISGESMVQSSLRLGQIQIDNDSIFWTEGRPTEKGRTVLMTWSHGASKAINPEDTDVRTRAHEYGGGAFLADKGRVFYINNRDQQIYETGELDQTRQITNAENYRYADAILDDVRQVLYVVGEDHRNPKDVQNVLLRVALDGSGEQSVIASGHDFYSNPQLSPDGSKILFLTWDLPDMPWEGTQLWLADLSVSGDLSEPVCIAGSRTESIFQPLWDPNGSLYFVSDRNGWWNLYHYNKGQSHCILEMDEEFGLPQWVFGMSAYSVHKSGELVAICKSQQCSRLVRIDVQSGATQEIEVPYSVMDQIRVSGSTLAFIGHSETQPGAVVTIDLNSSSMCILQTSAQLDVSDENISRGELIQFESRPGEATYAWFYQPRNANYEGPSDEKPPLIVLSHGGPTAYSSQSFSLSIQFWTMRGFAVVDVNYSGSTGFGREYRERLNLQWGIRDVEDCASAAQFLVNEGYADANRLIIKGGSAGGYTTLAALTDTDVFKAGASYYGVGDLTLLAKDTHKFESRYLDGLVGAYPEEKDTYLKRSPLNHVNQLNCPVIFMQGLDDPVVPPNQAEAMVSALKQNGIPVAYLPFEGESHGFRQSKTIVKTIESEYAFYVRVFGIETSNALEPLEIINLK
mgnify:CR=1 FL=1